MDRQTENTCSQSERNTHAELEYARLVNVRFPEKIAALSHTLELVDEMLMSTPEAIIKAAQTNQLTWLKYLVHEYDPNLSEAVIAAASNGHTEAVMYLLGIINRPEDSSDSSSDEGDDEAGEDGEDSRGFCYRARKAFRKAIVAAATYGHLEVVSCFLPQLVGSGRDPDLLREMHNVTWEVLDIAAANGRLNIVTFAVEIAIEWCYLELYTPTSGVDALRLSIAGGHFHMAQFFLELYQIKWNMLAACEEAVIADQFILVEWIFVLYSQYSASEHLLIDLVQNGQAVAVRYLCENFQMCPEIIDTAFRLAKKIEVVRALYETRPIAVGSITVKFRDAARCGIYEEVQCYPGDEEIEIVQLLSKDERIPSHVLRKAFVDAANNCHETLLKLLWDDNRLDSQTRVRAFMKAVNNNHVDVVKSLCAEDHVSSYLEGQALFLACKKGFNNIAIFLFNRKSIAQPTRERAFVSAACQNRYDVVQLMCQQEEWPLTILTKAFNKTTSDGLKTFLRNKLDETEM